MAGLGFEPRGPCLGACSFQPSELPPMWQFKCTPFFQHSHFLGWPVWGEAGHQGSHPATHPALNLALTLGEQTTGQFPRDTGGRQGVNHSCLLGKAWSQHRPQGSLPPHKCRGSDSAGRNYSQIKDGKWGLKTLNPLGLLSGI